MTPFGIYLRSLRAAHDVKLKELAYALGVKAPYLSCLERGKANRGKPNQKVIEGVIDFFQLNPEQASELYLAAENSDPRLVLDDTCEPSDYELAHLFISKLSNLSDFQRKFIKDLLNLDELNEKKTQDTNHILRKSQEMIRKGELKCA